MVEQLRCALNPRIADLTYFFGVKPRPFFAVKLLVEFLDVADMG